METNQKPWNHLEKPWLTDRPFRKVIIFRDKQTDRSFPLYIDDDVSFEESWCDEDEEYKEDNDEQRKVIIMILVIVTDVQNVWWSTCLCGEMEADKGEVTSRTCSTMYWFTWVGNVVVIIRTDEHIGCWEKEPGCRPCKGIGHYHYSSPPPRSTPGTRLWADLRVFYDLSNYLADNHHGVVGRW